MSTGARPASVRTLLRASKRFGRDAARRRDRSSGVRRAERALSRGLGRLGHWGDARNPYGARRVIGRWWLVGLGALTAAALAAMTVSGRRRARGLGQ